MIWQLHLVHAPSHVKGQVLSLANVQRLLQATQQASCCCDALSRKSIVVKKLPRSQAKRVKGCEPQPRVGHGRPVAALPATGCRYSAPLLWHPTLWPAVRPSAGAKSAWDCCWVSRGLSSMHVRVCQQPQHTFAAEA